MVVFLEKNTIVLIGDFLLSKYQGSTVTNLSTKWFERDHFRKNSKHYYSAVGESNVVDLMKKENAIFGGEGSGGVIFPKFHYGRDALVGIGLFLSYFSEKNILCSEIKKTLPNYFMLKDKIFGKI